MKEGSASDLASDCVVDFGREVCGDLEAAEQREWLVTNGIGGYGSGTLGGLLTRRYHGLLVAALRPPLGRTLLVSKLDEMAEYDGRSYPLSTNRWLGGAVDPQGYRYVERFRLEGTTPVWTLAFSDALLEKRVWMAQGSNTTYVRYELVRAARPVKLAVKVLVNYRDHHATTLAGDWRMNIQPVERGLRVEAFAGAAPFYALSREASARPAHDWYRNFDLALERARGLDDHEDHLYAGTFDAELDPGSSATIAASTDAAPDLDGQLAWEVRRAHEEGLRSRWLKALPCGSRQAQPWVGQLALAADQFIVRRTWPDVPEASSVIAGYHWFGDWGRDAMIALPGLALATGRPRVAQGILQAFARLVDRGMLPNRFPEAGEAAEYNTVDAALWYLETVRQYFATTHDVELLRRLFPVLTDVVDWHLRGTRHNIHVDPVDGLLYAGEPGVQLTWMDAKIGDWVVTPRVGKPVEISALWLNALATVGQFAKVLKEPADRFQSAAEKARKGFARFWNEALGYCFDVLDGPEGNDASLRPNQIFAVSLPESALTAEQQRAIVDISTRHLLTPYGLRSLAPSDPRYQGHYGGGPRERDAAYHQGTAWGWLLGPFALAHLRVYQDPERAASLLEPMASHMKVHGLGSAGEIFDGDAPFAPRGCIAQAWSVAETLRAWTACRETAGKSRKQ